MSLRPAGRPRPAVGPRDLYQDVLGALFIDVPLLVIDDDVEHLARGAAFVRLTRNVFGRDSRPAVAMVGVTLDDPAAPSHLIRQVLPKQSDGRLRILHGLTGAARAGCCSVIGGSYGALPMGVQGVQMVECTNCGGETRVSIVGLIVALL